MQTLLLGSESVLDLCTGDEVNSSDFDVKMKQWCKSDKIAKKLFVTIIESKPLHLIMNCGIAQQKLNMPVQQKKHYGYGI